MSQLCRRHFGKSLTDKLIILVLCTGVTLVLIELDSLRRFSSRQSDAALYKSLMNGDQLLNIARTESYDKIKNRPDPKQQDVSSAIDCPIIDFFASVDETANIYDRDLLCDEKARKSDIVCRMYFRQIGLEHLASSTCMLEDPNKVPKVVYFVIFGYYQFKFWHYIALMAAKRHISPTAIYVIGDQHPMGRWWQQTLRDVHGVRFLYREPPQKISGKKVNFRHHISDVVRLQTIYMNGGIYLDADMVVVRDLDPLLDFDITLGMVENGTGMGNAFIAAKRGSPFIREWYTEYTRYKEKEFYWNSLQVPRNMWFKSPSRLHMESERLYRPNWFEADLLFKRSDYPWWNNYAIHIWTNGNPVPKSPADIQTANSTIAQVFRKAMYGDWKPRINKLTKEQNNRIIR